MFSYKANAICMAGMAMSAEAGVATSHRVQNPDSSLIMHDFDLTDELSLKNRTAHAKTHYRKSTQWQWASFVNERPIFKPSLIRACGRTTPNKPSIGKHANFEFRDRHFLPLFTIFWQFSMHAGIEPNYIFLKNWICLNIFSLDFKIRASQQRHHYLEPTCMPLHYF